jgi:hypothetical protein
LNEFEQVAEPFCNLTPVHPTKGAPATEKSTVPLTGAEDQFAGFTLAVKVTGWSICAGDEKMLTIAPAFPTSKVRGLALALA